MSKKLKLAFFATMSAGKTTCINALLGTELLHSANEATTATITTISYGDTHHVMAYDKDSSLISEVPYIDRNHLKALNQNQEVQNINIKSSFNIDKRLVIVDTPGPNNSMDNSHASLSYQCLEDHGFDYVIYLINATQPFINDDLVYLRHLSKKVKNNRILFLINKIDELDFQIESAEFFLENLKKYLSDLDFTQPVILAVSAYHALILKKLARNEQLTKKEKRVLLRLIEDDEKNEFLKSLKLSQEIILSVSKKNYFEFLGQDFQDKEILNKIYRKTGFPYLEKMIEREIKQLNMKQVGQI